MKTHQNKFNKIITIDKANLSELTDKYMFYCLVLDELAFLKYYKKSNEPISSSALQKRVFGKMSFGLMNTPIAQLDIWLVDMQFMKLLSISFSRDHSQLIINNLTENGEIAYQNQTYHQIYANLVAAKRSRILTVVTIVLSFISLVVAVISLIMSLSCK